MNKNAETINMHLMPGTQKLEKIATDGTINKRRDLNPVLPIITLSVNGLNIPVRRQRWSGWVRRLAHPHAAYGTMDWHWNTQALQAKIEDGSPPTANADFNNGEAQYQTKWISEQTLPRIKKGSL